MLSTSLLRSLRSVALGTTDTCLQCQSRSFRTAPRRLAEAVKPPPPAPRPFTSQPQSPAQKGKNGEEFVPQPLGRPIGFSKPPRRGENSGEDARSWRQRRAEFVDWGKHLERRKELTRQVAKPYFRDFSNMRHHKGKSFLANPRIFKRDAALFFPNLRGTTLASGREAKDTTEVLEGRVSVVSIFSSTWAENQKNTFVGETQNPELEEALKGNEDVAQRVEINIEENALKLALVRLFQYRLRAQRPKGDWRRYFIVSRGISESIRETIGLLNSKVGYVYLVDPECRIRWAGSGPAEGEEKQSLVKGLKKLIEEAKQGGQKKKPVKGLPAIEEELEAQVVAAGAS
ncbi:hypothetical protein W97_00573 [Coniosporium apollinis CBS 100218]|uniref:Mitochondrial ATPase complex subunit ATP10 n=1 Tax=Coniosporium apollinis (strain CBS 100218) TaxID=1168221 RepID=R7YHS3_CONA1|nr:uncharacterized protein W97_00573 [Coniosporium apollinis CBS 100218]EON61359.1 hypothetical protein W97_00573 [Coniosporium apollinis CBS 100218]